MNQPNDSLAVISQKVKKGKDMLSRNHCSLRSLGMFTF